MRKLFFVLSIATLTLSACGNWRESGANPRNWFGGGSAPSAQPTGVPTNPSDRQTGNPLIEDDQASTLVRANTTPVTTNSLFRRRNREVPYTGALIDQVKDMQIDTLPTGIIVRITGEPVREGAFDVRLLPVNPDGPIDGVAEFTLNAYQPADFGRGTENTRRVEAAVFLSNADLAEITEIRVIAARNTRSVRR